MNKNVSYGCGPSKPINYLFIDNESGEEFFVQAECFADAEGTAVENFGDSIRFIGKYTDEEAEWMGYDTY